MFTVNLIAIVGGEKCVSVCVCCLGAGEARIVIMEYRWTVERRYGWVTRSNSKFDNNKKKLQQSLRLMKFWTVAWEFFTEFRKSKIKNFNKKEKQEFQNPFEEKLLRMPRKVCLKIRIKFFWQMVALKLLFPKKKQIKLREEFYWP